MTPSLLLFFTLCALLCVLIALVVIYPWLKKSKVNDNRLMSVNIEVFNSRIAELDADKAAGAIDEAYYQAQSNELKRQLLAAKSQSQSYAPVGVKSRLIVMVWIPLLAALVYLTTSDRTAVYQLWSAKDSVGQVADDLLTAKIDAPPEWAIKDSAALISAMQVNVHAHAFDANRWMRLSELFTALEAKPQALEALSRAYRLEPDNVDIAMTYAQSGFFANNGVLDTTARNVLIDVLRTHPDHEGAQMLMAMGETRAGNFTNAKAWVHKLRSKIAASSGNRSEALASLDELLGNIESQEMKAAQGVNVSITVSDQILPKIKESDVLFVSISSAKGGAPYAVKRLPVSSIKEGGVTVSLSDLDAMMPSRTLTVGRDNDELIVNARISHSGGAISQSGDLSATPAVLNKTQNAVNLTISQIVP